ncbi:hypothetical protein KCP73_06620 [Salmonella enterica subsp. enterica]|nr:hypothetical protein KCP73_06620 [Salmonella enterica subsp. enterica]
MANVRTVPDRTSARRQSRRRSFVAISLLLGHHYSRARTRRPRYPSQAAASRSTMACRRWRQFYVWLVIAGRDDQRGDPARHYYPQSFPKPAERRHTRVTPARM